uniref:Uncharacterized protein n=1 Tax=Amphimedon queenslandica TaxID=400682 RepID=A0A1X7V7X8_AMPQE
MSKENEHQNSMLTVLQVEKKPLILGGDRCCDSPGFSAKYESYTFLEIQHNVVLNIELVQKEGRKVGKIKGCEEVGSWIKSMVNHLYWAAMSTEDGDPEMILEKWLSLGRHIHNKHHGHGTKFKCAHGRLRKRRWLKYNTKQSDQLLSVIIIKNYLVTSKLSNSYQTSCLDAFHSLINQYAPKHTAFSNTGMMTRLCLAALHYNHK